MIFTDKTFDESIAGIRKAERGVEVREGIAQGMEYVKQYAESAVQSAKNAAASESTASEAAKTATQKADAADKSAVSSANSASAAASSKTAAGESAAAAKASEEAAQKAAQTAQASVSTDTTLSIPGAPADAKAVGDALKKPATATALGVVKIGDGLSVEEDGTASFDADTLNDAQTTALSTHLAESFYTKAKADAEHAKLQEQISKAGGNVGQAIVVWDGYVVVPDHKSESFSLNGKIPDNVDYIVYLNEDPLFSSHGINVIIRRGETIKINNGTGRSYTFAEDGTLSSKYYGSPTWDYFYGYHYVTTAEGAMIPRVVSQSTVYYINGVQNDTYFNVPDETDYIVFQYKSTDYICSRIITRGSSYPGTMTFSSDGKISIPKSQASTFNGCLYTCYHYMTSEELSAQTEALAATQSAQSDTDALAVDQEYRLTLLELGLSDTDTQTTT